MDSKVTQLIRDLPESYEELKAVLKREGSHPYDVMFLQAEREVELLKAQIEAQEQAVKREIKLRFEAAKPGDGEWVCSTCLGRGMVEPKVQFWAPGDDWRMNDPRPCPACRGACFGPPKHTYIEGPNDAEVKRVIRQEVKEKYREDERELAAALDAATERHWQLGEAQDIKRGDQVYYANKRARAKFSSPREAPETDLTGERVPVGTVGEVFWEGQDNYSGARKFGIKVTEGEATGNVFFTVASNMGKTPEASYQSYAKRLEVEREDQKIKDIFGPRGPEKGLVCTARDKKETKTGLIFWVGRCKFTGRQKVGVKVDPYNKGEDPLWAFAADCTR